MLSRAARVEGSAFLGRGVWEGWLPVRRGSRVSAEHTCGSARPWRVAPPRHTCGPGGRGGTWPAGTLGFKPGPLHKLLIVMGGEGGCAAAPVRAVGLPASALCNAGDPCAVGFAVNSFHSCPRGVKNGIFQPGEVYLAQGAAQSSVPGKIRLHGPSRLWMLGEVEEWGTFTVFFHSVI